MLKCDYLCFTFKPARLHLDDYERIERKLSFCGTFDEYRGLTDFDYFMEAFPEIKRHYREFFIIENARHYRRRHCFNDSMYIYDDDGFEGLKGVNVEIPSHGLHLIKEWFSLEDSKDVIRDFFRIIFQRGCTISRLDVCTDINVSDSPVKPIDFFIWLSENRIKSHYRNLECCAGNVNDFIIRTLRDGRGGCTFYLGDRKHQILRVYDKEIESSGKIPAIRFEIEAHREKAMRIANAYIKHEFSFKELLLDMIDVLAYSSDTENRSRIPREEVFEELISCLTNNEDYLFVPEAKLSPSLQSSIAWARKVFSRILTLEYLSPSLKADLDRLRLSFIPSDTDRNNLAYIKQHGLYR